MTQTYCYPYKRGTGWRSQEFRSHPESPYNPPGGHTGFDQAMDAGTPIFAPGDGIIRNSGWLTDNYLANDWWLTAMGGDTLVIDCFGPDGTTATGPTFIIAHLQDSTAPVGAVVKKGQQIGISGNSGTATTGAHAHIEALPPNWDWNNGVYGRVDPELYFTEYPDTITYQSTTPKGLFVTLTPAQEKLVVDRNEKYVDSPISQVDEKVWGTVIKRTGGNKTALQELADCKTLLLTQQATLSGLLKAIEQLAQGSGASVDLEAVTKAAEAGAERALADLNAVVTFEKAGA